MSQTFTSRIKIALTGAGKASKKTNKLSKGMDNLAKSALRAGAGFFAARGIINALKKSVQLSTQQIALSKGFDALTSKMGMSAAAMKNLQAATDGTVNSIDLMKAANQAMTLGVVDSEEGMAKLFDTAQRLGKSLGVDTVGAIDSLVTGMGRQSILMLDNLGIIVDTKKAQEDYAESIDKTASQLTDQEKKIAFNTAALAAAEQKVSDLGDEQLDVGDSLQQSWVKIEEAMANIGTKVVPALADVATFASNALEDLQGLWDWATGADDDPGNLIQMMKDAGISTDKYEKQLLKVQIAQQKNVVLSKRQETGYKDLAEGQKQLEGLHKNYESILTQTTDASIKAADAQQDIQDAIKDSSGAIGMSFKELSQGFDKFFKDGKFTDDWVGLGKELENTGIKLTDLIKVIDPLSDAADGLNDSVSIGQDLISSYPELVEYITEFIVEEEKLLALKEKLAKLEKEELERQSGVKDSDNDQIKRTKLKLDGMKKLSKETVNAAMVIGAAQQDAAKAAGAAATAFVMAELQKAIAIYITDAFSKFGIFGGVLGAAAGGVVGNVFSRTIQGAEKTFAAEGFDGIVTEPTLIVAGEAGPEYVDIEPTTNEGAKRGGSTIVFQGNVMSQDFIEDEAIPMIREALRKGGDIGIG